jgi:hypothetical protein
MDAIQRFEHDGGLFWFSVPETWQREVEQDGSQIFWNELAGSGTLRVSSLTMRKLAESETLPQLGFLAKDKPPNLRDDGVAWVNYRVEGEENGEATVMFWWEFAHFIPPSYGRLAFFSFTIYAHEENDAGTQDQLRALGHLPSTVEFGPLQNFER